MRVAYAAATLNPTSVHNPPDIRDVRDEPFKFQSNQTNSRSPRRNFDAAGVLHRLRVRNGVGKTVIPGDGFRNHHPGIREATLEKLLRAFVRVEVPQLKM